MAEEYKPTYGLVNKPPYLTNQKPAYTLPPMLYGERLRIARRHAKLSQQELAEKSGVKQPTISQLESGEGEGSMYTVQFATACGVSPMWLATEKGEMLPDGYYTQDRKLISAMQVMEALPEYGKDAAIKELAEIKELIDKARSDGTHDER